MSGETRGAGWFALTKWYADTVTPAGELLICYVASLRLGPAHVRYAAALELDAAGASLRQRASLRGGVVETDAEGVRLSSGALGLHGRWQGSGTAPQVVAETADGRVEWQGLCMDAAATVTCAGRPYDGVGYAEVVRLSVPPWRLPFGSLEWGRFVADDRASALTWIATDGSQALSRAWTPTSVGGRPADVRDDGVTCDGVRLTWDAGRQIRSDRVASTLFGAASPLGRLLPRGVRNLTEDKRLSRGVLASATGIDQGWVVHERVSW